MDIKGATAIVTVVIIIIIAGIIRMKYTTCTVFCVEKGSCCAHRTHLPIAMASGLFRYKGWFITPSHWFLHIHIYQRASNIAKVYVRGLLVENSASIVLCLTDWWLTTRDINVQNGASVSYWHIMCRQTRLRYHIRIRIWIYCIVRYCFSNLRVEIVRAQFLFGEWKVSQPHHIADRTEIICVYNKR